MIGHRLDNISKMTKLAKNLTQLEPELHLSIVSYLWLVDIVRLSRTCRQFRLLLAVMKQKKRDLMVALPRVVAITLLGQMRAHFKAIASKPIETLSFYEHHFMPGRVQWADGHELTKPMDGTSYAELGYTSGAVWCEFPIKPAQTNKRRHRKYDEIVMWVSVETETSGVIERLDHCIDGNLDTEQGRKPIEYTGGLFAEMQKLGFIDTLDHLKLYDRNVHEAFELGDESSF